MKERFEALETLTDRDPDQRDVAAAVLGDLLRGTALDAATARRAVGSLVNLATNEPVTSVRESALNSISEAFSYHSLPLDLVEPLAPALPTMTGELLAHSVYIFGATRDPQARPLIEPFLHHPDADVREEARQAAAEITRPKPDGHIQKS
ncbi:HEAT repeat domain-containing protein [Streptomyces sp. 021-4]|uniref:HEAT repeat domain-containing protein n=1 Tax=Streptomyces sp. 021-4 TaxID=2789260 RepID=UPI0039F5BA3B